MAARRREIGLPYPPEFMTAEVLAPVDDISIVNGKKRPSRLLDGKEYNEFP